MIERVRVRVHGVVQGVGFRPFVYRLAHRHGLAGWVLNHEAGVDIELEGDPERIRAFLEELRSEAPPLARIDRLEVERRQPQGARAFEIRPSRSRGEPQALVPPDIATCERCLREVFDPNDRRHRYPFTNCTDCGPRFTIIRELPYDRPRTTMASFRMCPRCEAEYHDPLDRRFHAQPNACPRCGPRLALLDGAGRPVAGADPLVEAARLLREGRIVAVKGLGGFHLACDAANEEAVSLLRRRKAREAKPFALMCRDLEVVRRLCELPPGAAELLSSPQRPILVLPRRPDAGVAPSVAPGQRTLGVMLPYTPLHHLLLRESPPALVMTSGNRSEEPIVRDNQEALERLRGIADWFLVHDREIYVRCDDSVARPWSHGVVLLRRARGYAPLPIELPGEGRPVLACGGQLKNTVCLTRGRLAFLSQHLGDLDSWEAFENFRWTIGHLRRLLGVEPELVAHDLHPDYASTRYALELGLPTVGVQHHFAHALSCLAEHGLEGPALAVVMDGTGWGEDGAVWGGEFLQVSLEGYRRLGHLRYVPLPGGEAAVREPWRMAAAYLDRLYGEAMARLDLPLLQRMDWGTWEPLRQAVRAGIGSPPCSSVGRLFDAVSALLGLRLRVSYEGQAAMELEQIARGSGEYPMDVQEAEDRLVLDPDPLIAAVVEDVRRGEDPGVISARFHHGLARAVLRMVQRMRERTGIELVVLSGGVFQNRLLLERTWELLSEAGLRALVHRRVPPNDGGISLGQALYAMRNHVPGDSR